MQQQQPRYSGQVHPADIHLHYMQRDLDQTKDKVSVLGDRVTALEKRGNLSEKLDWKMIGIIGLIILGLTGHITIQEIKALVLGVL